MANWSRWVFACVATLCATQAGAQKALSVMEDSGRTVPAQQYQHALVKARDTQSLSPLIALPIKTPGLRAGKLERSGVLFPNAALLAEPLFIVGTDHASRAWLSRERAALQALGAAGIVVDVPSVKAFRDLEELAEGLRLAPAAADAVAQDLRRLGIQVYPLVILQDGRIVDSLFARGTR